MNKEIVVSVLTPVYNHKIEYVKRCFESLSEQTARNIEFIIIDNGATTETKNVIEEFLQKDNRFRVIHLEKNLGYGKAMNIAIKEAKGKFIGTVESDDFIEPTMYEELISKILDNTVDIVKLTFRFYTEDSSNCKIGRVFANDLCNKVLKNTEILDIPKGHASQWCAIYRKSMLVNNGIFYNETPGATHQDMPFVLKTWFFARGIVVFNAPLYHYRIDNTNASSHQKNKTPWGSHKEYQLLDEFMRKHEKDMKPEFWHIKSWREYGNKIYFYKNLITKYRFLYLKLCMSNVFEKAMRDNKVDFSMFNSESAKEYKYIAKHPVRYYLHEVIKNQKLCQVKKQNTHYMINIINGVLKISFKKKVSTSKKLDNIISEIQAIKNLELNVLKNVINIQREEIAQLNVVVQAQTLHPTVFSKYRDSFKGQDVVLVCTGPSAKKYKPIPDAIHIGVNGAIYLKDLHLDYLFVQDNTINQKHNETLNIDINNYEPDSCQKFYGVIPPLKLSQIEKLIARIPLSYSNNPNVKQYLLSETRLCNWAYDISREPIADYLGTAFSAMQFILYCNPKRIYLVGCDCSSGYAYNDKENFIPVTGQEKVWRNHVKPYTDLYFPNTEIISINPVNLKGLFKDIYTE